METVNLTNDCQVDDLLSWFIDLVKDLWYNAVIVKEFGKKLQLLATIF